MATNNALQNTFRTDFAGSLIEEFNAKSDDQYYVFFGKITSWPDDTSPSGVVDSVESNFSSIRNAYGIKRIDRTNLFHIVTRYDWSSGTAYDMYDDTIDMSSKKYYVMTDEYNLYKCIENGNGGNSTSKPTHTEPEIKASGDDGYKWKFLGKVTETARTFLTRDYIPIEYVTDASEDENASQLSSQRDSIDGAVDTIIVSSTGSELPFRMATKLGESIPISRKIRGSTDREVLLGSANAGTTIAVNASNFPQNTIIPDSLRNMSLLTVSGLGPDVGQIRTVMEYIPVEAGVTYEGSDGQELPHTDNYITIDAPFTRTLYGTESQVATEYRILPPVKLFGDGKDSVVRTEIDDDLKITKVIPLSRGKNYTKAWIDFPKLPEGSEGSGNSGVPSARVIIGPRGGHGSNPITELQSNKVMIVLSVNRDENRKLRVSNDYRQFGIIKNPKLNSKRYGITAGQAGKEYLRTTRLRVSKPHGIETPYSYLSDNSTYSEDNYIMGEESFATARVLSWYPQSGGTGDGNLVVENIQGNFVQGSLVDNYVRFVFGPSYGNSVDAAGQPAFIGGDFVVGATVSQSTKRGWPSDYLPSVQAATAEGIVHSWDSKHRELVIRVTKNTFTNSIESDYVKQYIYDGNNQTLGLSAAYWSFDSGDTRFEDKGGELIKQFSVQSTAEGIYGGTFDFVTLTENTGGGPQTYSSYGRIMGLSQTEIDENLNPVYSTTTRLKIGTIDQTALPGKSSFVVDSGITQDNGGSNIVSSKLLEYDIELGVGASQGFLHLTDVVGTFVTGGNIIYGNDVESQEEGWEVLEVQHPEIDLTSGEVLYIQNIRPISRSIEQDEEYKIVIGF